MNAIDSLRAMVDSERLRSKASELLADLGPDAIREIAEKLTEIADAIDEAVSEVEAWADAETKDEKADARDTALEAIESVCNAAEFDLGEIGDVPDWIGAMLGSEKIG